ncbi:PilZ domain-containing protein [Sedimenticola thiotaurini]|uniref:Cyclic diguanosine monophosphate-binding protein n=1 Tax=Sedimenticola thiotaurini TaxID=1543721 RepID=A0A0F7JVF6_9GAMM|nr:PilZ domain-containing protein [Sedimenticola thiotaurini]AKH19537.1 hypothetical protein AAY24_03285 [Sedimenticola thiotaurini]
MTSADKNERRNFQRILFDAPVTISHNNKLFCSKLVDISLNGALLETTDQVDVQSGDTVFLNIRLGEEFFIDMEAQLTHLEGGRLGLRCVHIDMESIAHLRRLVELNLGDSKLLERELSALG